MDPRTSWEMVAPPSTNDEVCEHEESTNVEDDDPNSPALLNFRANARASRDRIATYLRQMREEAEASERETVQNNPSADEATGTVDHASQYARPRNEWPTFGHFPMPEDADPNIVALRLAEADETGQTLTGHPFFDNPFIFTADTYPNGRSSFSSTDSDRRIFKSHVDFIDPETPWRGETHPDAPMPWVIGEDDPVAPSTTVEKRCVVQKGWLQPRRSVTTTAERAPEIEEPMGEVRSSRGKRPARGWRSDLSKMYQESEDQDGRKDSRLGTMDLAEVDGTWPPGMRRSSSQRLKRNAVKIVRAQEAEDAIESDDEEEQVPRMLGIHHRRVSRATENVNPTARRQTPPFPSPLRTPNINIVRPNGNESEENHTSNEPPATSPSPSSPSPKRWWQPSKSPKGILKKTSPTTGGSIGPPTGPRLQWARDVAFGPRRNLQPGNSSPVSQVSTIFAPLYGVSEDASDREMQASTPSLPLVNPENNNDATDVVPARSDETESTDSDSTITPLTARRRELMDRLAKHLKKP